MVFRLLWALFLSPFSALSEPFWNFLDFYQVLQISCCLSLVSVILCVLVFTSPALSSPEIFYQRLSSPRAIYCRA